MNKKGFIFTLMISLLLAALIISGLLYLKIRFGGLEFKTGNIVYKIGYEKEKTLENKNIKNMPSNLTNYNISSNISIKDYNITD